MVFNSVKGPRPFLCFLGAIHVSRSQIPFLGLATHDVLIAFDLN